VELRFGNGLVASRQAKSPDVVLASAGDYMTQEAMQAVAICKELVPDMKVRYVNISELTSMCMGDYYPRHCACVDKKQVEKYFTKDKPVVLNYHGYVNDVEHILFPFVDPKRFSIHGYHEEGSTTTPFDIKVLNKVSCYHLAMDMIEQAAKKNKKIARRKVALVKKLKSRIRRHHNSFAKVVTTARVKAYARVNYSSSTAVASSSSSSEPGEGANVILGLLNCIHCI